MSNVLVAPLVVAIGLMTIAHASSSPQRQPANAPSTLDHLIFGTPNLALGVDTIDKLVGIRATPGGQHPGEGTRNALISLGPDTYLEILGPDPGQPKPGRPRWFAIDDLTAPKLVGWAAKGDGLAQLVTHASRNGIRLGEVLAGSRQTPQGGLLTWQVTNQRARLADGIIPFFIDWGQTPHPAGAAATGASLIDLRAEHPDPASVERVLSVLGLELRVTQGPRATLIATVSGPLGRVELR